MNLRPSLWNRLMRKPAAVFGASVIAMALFIAVFAYLLAPDGSPNANRMIPEIANQKPGFQLFFLQVKKNYAGPGISFLGRIWNGQEGNIDWIPVAPGYAIRHDTLFAQKYIDENIFEKIMFPLSQLATTPVIRQRFWLGTDKFGRDILSRLILGTRVSLSVGIIAVAVSLSIGVVLGALAGFLPGRTDNIITWLINVIWSIPTLLLVFAITLALGKGFWQIFIAVGLTLWVNVARLVRGQVRAMSQMEFVEAAKVLGFSSFRTVTFHILPNIIGPVMVIAASNFAAAIVIEAGLSFLGVGVQPPEPSWGLMIKENYNFIITSRPMLALVPGIAIMLLVLAFNLLGNALRDATDNRDE